MSLVISKLTRSKCKNALGHSRAVGGSMLALTFPFL